MESLLIGLRERGNTVYLLTTCGEGQLHSALRKEGVEAIAHPISQKNILVRYLYQVRHLILFCVRHRIDVVHSHLQSANVIAIGAQYFIRSRVVLFRHHFEPETKGVFRNRNEVFGEKTINKFGKEIVVPSSGVFRGMFENEKVNLSKIRIVPYVYDFSRYGEADLDKVASIRAAYSAELLLLISSRMIKPKRHLLALEALGTCIREGMDIKVLVTDDGPERDLILDYVKMNNLNERVFLLGYRPDLFQIMHACDLLVHPSIREASNSTVKEMALACKPSIIVAGVGDFDEYIVNGKNGFVIDPAKPEVPQLCECLVIAYKDKNKLTEMGRRLRDEVRLRFQVNNQTLALYEELL